MPPSLIIDKVPTGHLLWTPVETARARRFWNTISREPPAHRRRGNGRAPATSAAEASIPSPSAAGGRAELPAPGRGRSSREGEPTLPPRTPRHRATAARVDRGCSCFADAFCRASAATHPRCWLRTVQASVARHCRESEMATGVACHNGSFDGGRVCLGHEEHWRNLRVRPFSPGCQGTASSPPADNRCHLERRCSTRFVCWFRIMAGSSAKTNS